MKPSIPNNDGHLDTLLAGSDDAVPGVLYGCMGKRHEMYRSMKVPVVLDTLKPEFPDGTGTTCVVYVPSGSYADIIKYITGLGYSPTTIREIGTQQWQMCSE